MTPETANSAIDQTAPSTDPPAGASASIVERRRLGLADTAASGQGTIVTGDTLRSEGPTPIAAPIPARIGRYMVIRPLGAGGMGVVVEAFDPELDRRVAIKLLKAERSGGGESQVRLLREAQAMARLSHPNVVGVHDVGMVGDQVFVAMELVRGQTLAHWLGERPRPWREVVARFVEAARGLAAAHAVGLVHRDFKPDNVLLADDGRVKVADFGLAREERLALPEGAAEAAREDDVNPGERPLLADSLTATGVLMGTPMYMSPEQHRAAPAGPASDIFSFSVALFEGLHGQRPFAGDSLALIARAVLRGEIDAPRGGREVPAWLDAAVRRGLQLRPEERWPSFDAYIAAIDRDPARTRRRWLGLGGLALGAALAGGALTAGGAPEVCTGAAAAIAEVWDGAAADRLRGRLAGLPEGIRAATETRTLDALDAYARGWAEIHGRACLGNHRGERSDALLDAQMRCLAGRKAAMGDALALLEGGSQEVLADAALLVHKLPPLAACEDDAALLAAVPPPADPTQRGAVEGVRRRLAEAELMVHAGRYEAALAAAAALREEAAGLAYPPLIGEAALAEGRIAIAAHAFPRANAALDDALVAASAAGDDATAAEASARLLFSRAIEPAPGRGDPLLERAHAEALVTRLGARGDLQALVANNVGVLLDLRGDREGARERFAEAVRLASEDPRVDPIERASGYRRNLALTTDDPDERARLFDAVAAELEARLGPDHLTLLTLALTRAATSAPAEAAAIRQSTCPKIQAFYPARYELCVDCYHNLLHDLDGLARGEEAAAAARGIAACVAAPIDPIDAEWMATWDALGRGYAGLLGGEPAPAAEAFEAAIRAAIPYAELPGAALLLADARIGQARAFIAQGTPERARRPLDAAITSLEPMVETNPQGLPPALLDGARALRVVVDADPGADAPSTR